MALTQHEKDAAHRQLLLLVREKRYDEAISNARTQIETWPQPDKAQAWHNLAYATRLAGDFQETLNAISNAVTLDPNNASHRDARACWALDMHLYDLVIEDCGALLEIEKSRQSIAFVNASHLLRGFAYLKLKNSAAALEDFEQLTDEGPFHVCRKNWRKAELILEARRMEKENEFPRPRR